MSWIDSVLTCMGAPPWPRRRKLNLERRSLSCSKCSDTALSASFLSEAVELPRLSLPPIVVVNKTLDYEEPPMRRENLMDDEVSSSEHVEDEEVVAEFPVSNVTIKGDEIKGHQAAVIFSILPSLQQYFAATRRMSIACEVRFDKTIFTKFRELEQNAEAASQSDVYSKGFVPKKMDKESSEYGRPKPGTLTEQRAKKAAAHVAREMLTLCEVVEDYGKREKDGEPIRITFGRLFGIYVNISDKVVGTLLRARKHKMVDFEGEMLFQRRDDHVIITLLLEGAALKEAIRAHAAANPKD
ncbi:unnamed protein product [Caenorhabditis sp. 36 PRJEB53466]|nr:unnamed protein product [Caenorhabditis sp. 36 PRJEB53466]